MRQAQEKPEGGPCASGNRYGRAVATVKVMLLGPPRVERDGEPVAFDTRKAVALLAHLALVDRPRSRDALAELLWPCLLYTSPSPRDRS